mmetsp:Transcript_6618/g.8587  ORF Transcript_6618/g.8587 Transcript_6618/m.8587 type:complete len:690 (+) Transcript_6618:66-2135(+)
MNSMNFSSSMHLHDQEITDQSLVEKVTLSLRNRIGGKDTIDNLVISFNEIGNLIPLLELRSPSSTAVSTILLFNHLMMLDVRHNHLRSFEGLEQLTHLVRFLGCHNPSVKSLSPLMRLPRLEELWVSHCGIIATDAMLLVECQQAMSTSSNDNCNGSFNKSFKDKLRILVINNSPLSKNPVVRPLLIKHFTALEWFDDHLVTPLREPSLTFLKTADGSGMMHRLRAQLRIFESKKGILPSSSSPSSSSRSTAKVNGRRPSNTMKQTNKVKDDGDKSKYKEGDVLDEGVELSSKPLDHENQTYLTSAVMGDHLTLLENRKEQRGNETTTDNGNGTNGISEITKDDDGNVNIREEEGPGKTLETNTCSVDTDAVELIEPSNLTSEVTLSNCLDGLGADIDKLLNIPMKKQKEVLGVKKKRKQTRQSSIDGGGSSQGGTDEIIPTIPVTPCDLITNLHTSPVAPCTLHYPRTNDKSRGKSKGNGPLALVVRDGGFASAKWPSGVTAVTFSPESVKPSISAFFPNGTLAVMIDTYGYGSANFSSGQTALSTNKQGGFICKEEDGSFQSEWKRQTEEERHNKKSLTNQSYSVILGEGFGLVCSLNSNGDTFISLFFKYRNIHALFSQETGTTSLLAQDSGLFGEELTRQSSSPMKPRLSRNKAGIRALEASAAEMPPLSHSELIEGLRSSIADL